MTASVVHGTPFRSIRYGSESRVAEHVVPERALEHSLTRRSMCIPASANADRSRSRTNLSQTGA